MAENEGVIPINDFENNIDDTFGTIDGSLGDFEKNVVNVSTSISNSVGDVMESVGNTVSEVFVTAGKTLTEAMPGFAMPSFPSPQLLNDIGNGLKVPDSLKSSLLQQKIPCGSPCPLTIPAILGMIKEIFWWVIDYIFTAIVNLLIAMVTKLILFIVDIEEMINDMYKKAIKAIKALIPWLPKPIVMMIKKIFILVRDLIKAILRLVDKIQKFIEDLYQYILPIIKVWKENIICIIKLIGLLAQKLFA